jgi:ABC-2 type transport system permease protein
MRGVKDKASPERSAGRTLYWSIRRELMEHRWIYRGQVAIAAVILLGFLISTIYLPAHMRKLSESSPADAWETIAMPYNIAAGVFMGVMILMAVFYCSDALYGERRDRNVLFWKSLPVSDVTTVLGKASIPLVVLPLLTFAVTVSTQAIMLSVSSLVLLGNGLNAATMWRELSVFRMWGLLLYHLLTAHALWPFPVYCWLLLVSSWARRTPLLWAMLPVVVIGIVEKLTLHTSRCAETVGLRLIGGGAPTDMTPGDLFPMGPMTHITPGELLSTQSLWLGMLFAAIFLAIAVRLRRYRPPI